MQRAGVFYTGEMGTALARRLIRAGFVVTSCVSGRGEKTRVNARNTGVLLRDSLEQVVSESNFLFSLVPPNGAVDMAELVAASMRSTGFHPLFVDCNSVAPSTMGSIRSIIESSGGAVLDGAFIGSASTLESKAMLCLSGEKVDELAPLLEHVIRVVTLGKEVGAASAFKMCFAGFNKGLVALFLEISSAADKVGMSDVLLRSLEDFYPGTVETVRRLLPTYPLHCARRLHEMEELVSFLRENEQVPAMSLGICVVLEQLEEIFQAEIDGKGVVRAWTFDQILELCSSGGLLNVDMKNS